MDAIRFTEVVARKSLVAALLWASAQPIWAAAQMQDLGVLSGTSNSHARAVDADGSVIVGASGSHAFRWTAGSGMQDLGFLSGGGLPARAQGVSADGSVVVGASGDLGFRWTVGTGMQDIGSLFGFTTAAMAVSANGLVVVGASNTQFSIPYRPHAFRWTSGGGMRDLGVLPGETDSGAQGVNADGTVIVGNSGSRAFRWTTGGGMQDLGTLPGGNASQAWGVNADGSVIVGMSFVAGFPRAYRWTIGGGMQNLGVLPGGSSSFAYGVSADGSVVVGSCLVGGVARAFRWTSTGGMQDIGTFPNGRSAGASGISANGSIIVGSGDGFPSGNHAFRYGFTKIPLGRSLTSAMEGEHFKVYVPTRWGGELTISTTAGTIRDLLDPDGQPFTNGSETEQGKFGWYTFQVEGASSYTVSNTYIQEGEAETVPWNFWYFPLKPVVDPNLFDNPGACTKYDAKFALGTTTFDWEIANHRNVGAGSWWGHCGGGALASIILEQPPAAHSDGFSQDELEGLAAEFFKGDLRRYRRLASFSEKYEGKRASPATTDDVDPQVHKFHNEMRKMLHGKRKAFWIELRQADGVARSAEIWNQGCYKYTAIMEEDPDAAGDPESEMILQIKIKNNFICNDDFLDASRVSVGDPKSNPMLRREQETEYILMFGEDGTILPNGVLANRKQNWISMMIVHSADPTVLTPAEVYVPWCMGDVTPAGSRFFDSDAISGENPNVTARKLISLGLQKNPGF